MDKDSAKTVADLRMECQRLRGENESLSLEIFARDAERTGYILALKRWERKIHLFHHLYEQVSRAADNEEIHRTVVAYLAEKLGFDQTAVFLLERSVFKVAASYGFDREFRDAGPLTPVFLKICETGFGVLSSNGSVDDSTVLPRDVYKAQSFIIVPFRAGVSQLVLFAWDRFSSTWWVTQSSSPRRGRWLCVSSARFLLTDRFLSLMNRSCCSR